MSWKYFGKKSQKWGKTRVFSCFSAQMAIFEPESRDFSCFLLKNGHFQAKYTSFSQFFFDFWVRVNFFDEFLSECESRVFFKFEIKLSVSLSFIKNLKSSEARVRVKIFLTFLSFQKLRVFSKIKNKLSASAR